MIDNDNYKISLRFGRYKLLIIAFALLVTIMSFTGFVNYITFANNYNYSLANTYAVAGNETVRELEYALQYGKPIDNFFGMHETLNELTKVITEVEQIQIVTLDGKILYDLKGFVTDKYIPNNLINKVLFKQSENNLNYSFFEGKNYLFISIKDTTSSYVASLVMIFPENTFLQFNSPLTIQLITYLGLFAVMALFIIAIILLKTKFIYSNNSINKNKILILFIVVLGVAQILYSSVNYIVFNKAYNDMAYTSKEFVASIVDKNIQNIYSKGLSLDNIDGFDEYIVSIEESLPQINEINLLKENDIQASITHVDVTVSSEYINQQMFKILLDMLTVLIISIFFMIELTLFATIIISTNQVKPATTHSNHIKTNQGLVRTLAFFVNLCAFMSLTFIPIVMNKLYQPILGLSKDVVLGLPISAEMLGGIFAIILAGWSISKQGWRSILYIGAFILLVGNVLSGFSDNAVTYILSRAIAGFGLGYILMSIRSLVVSLPETNTSIAAFGAGAIAGLNCGAVIGGMLVDRIGYSATFYLAAFLAVIPIMFVYRLMSDYEIEQRKTSGSSAFNKFIKFIEDKKALLFLVCIFIPFFISGAFLDYFFPLFSASHGLSQSDISRGFLLYGMFIIYLGPILTNYVTNNLGNLYGMMTSMFIVVCALSVFVVYETILAAFVALALLGIAESFGIAMKTSYFLNLKGIKDLQINQGIAFFSFMVNLSRMAGPMIFGIALSLGIKFGIGLIAVLIFLLLIFFIFSSTTQVTHSKKQDTPSI